MGSLCDGPVSSNFFFSFYFCVTSLKFPRPERDSLPSTVWFPLKEAEIPSPYGNHSLREEGTLPQTRVTSSGPTSIQEVLMMPFNQGSQNRFL